MAVREGRKTFEIRYNDRGFQAGDPMKLGHLFFYSAITYDPELAQIIMHRINGV